MLSRRRRRVLFLTGWYSHPLHEGIGQFAKEANWILNNEMCYSGVIPVNWEADGILCRHSFRKDLIDYANDTGVPVVGWEQSDRLPLPNVYVDQERIGEVAADHLLERGCKRCGFFHFSAAAFQEPRMVGFRRKVEEAGAEFHEFLVPKHIQWPIRKEYDWSWLKQRLEEVGLPLGMMTPNDLQAQPFLLALESLGLRIPEEVMVVSAENVQLLCETSGVTLSSVEANHRIMGYRAAELLERLMSGESPPPETILVEPGSVVSRQSTNTLCLENRHAQEALGFIWRHYREPISIDDVAGHVQVSRRRLQTVFLEQVGRTLQEEISRLRVEAACRLLEQGEHKVMAISSMCGFGSNIHIHRVFTSVFGFGPKAYAQKGRPSHVPRLPCPVEE